MIIKFHIPRRAPQDPSRPQWWIIGLDWSRQQGFQFVLRFGWGAIQVVRKCPVPNPLVQFTRPTVYAYEFIVHPNGANVARLVCKECGASYTLIPKPVPCAFCSVEKESGIRVYWGRARRSTCEGNLMYQHRWERINKV